MSRNLNNVLGNAVRYSRRSQGLHRVFIPLCNCYGIQRHQWTIVTRTLAADEHDRTRIRLTIRLVTTTAIVRTARFFVRAIGRICFLASFAFGSTRMLQHTRDAQRGHAPEGPCGNQDGRVSPSHRNIIDEPRHDRQPFPRNFVVTMPFGMPVSRCSVSGQRLP